MVGKKILPALYAILVCAAGCLANSSITPKEEALAKSTYEGVARIIGFSGKAADLQIRKEIREPYIYNKSYTMLIMEGFSSL